MRPHITITASRPPLPGLGTLELLKCIVEKRGPLCLVVAALPSVTIQAVGLTVIIDSSKSILHFRGTRWQSLGAFKPGHQFPSTEQTQNFFLRGYAKKGYTSLFLRQKGSHLKNVWTIYNKHSMISHCSPFRRKNTGEYPPVSIQLNKGPFLAVEITPFRRMHEIISERAVPPGSTTARLFCASAGKD